MPRARRIRGGLADPVIAALIHALPDPGTEWEHAARERWLSALQASFNFIYRPKSADDGPDADPVEDIA